VTTSAHVLRLATRGSALALAQTRLAADALRSASPGLTVEVVEVSTRGDQDRSTPLRVLGGEGVFVGAVRDAVIEGRADIAVHSLKDVPTAAVEGLTIAAMLERGDPRDVFLGRHGARLADLPAGARVGTSASRRVAILRALRPDLLAVDIRGNVETRISKLRAGEYDGIILAAAGLDRLGRLEEATQAFEARAFLPSPGQGVIALECRADDVATIVMLREIDHASTRAAAEAERGVLASLGTGCDLAVGAYGEVDGDLVTVRAMVGGDTTGAAPVFGEATGRGGEASSVGRGLGDRLKAAYAEAGGVIA
jgi:hydroxymethylbilane synthase